MSGRRDSRGCRRCPQMASLGALPVISRKYLIAAGVACLFAASPPPASAAKLSGADFVRLAARCAPAVPEWILHAVARTESDLRPWMLHDNTTLASYSPASLVAAEAAATAWIAEGHSVDLGLMQINSRNLPALGMTPRAALDPCASLAAGAAVLRAAYGGGTIGAGQQAALLMALSIYNTGSPLKGIMNGYVRKVLRNADNFVAPPSTSGSAAAPNIPPAWDISAMGAYTRIHGAPWLVPLGSSVAPWGATILTPAAAHVSPELTQARVHLTDHAQALPAAQTVVAANEAGSPRQTSRSP